MTGKGLVTIGELAKLAGLTVKTVRYWSDEGLVRQLTAPRLATGFTALTH